MQIIANEILLTYAKQLQPQNAAYSIHSSIITIFITTQRIYNLCLCF